MGMEEGEGESVEKAGPGPWRLGRACLCIKESQGLMQFTNISGHSVPVINMRDLTG